MARPEIAFSAQVMQKFYAAAVRKQRLQMTHEEAVAVLRSLGAFPVCSISRDLVLRAIDVTSHHISYWDAAIITAAQELGCEIIYSKDLSHGQEYDGGRVINPFPSLTAPPGMQRHAVIRLRGLACV